jgi:hypothetical protein
LKRLILFWYSFYFLSSLHDHPLPGERRKPHPLKPGASRRFSYSYQQEASFLLTIFQATSFFYRNDELPLPAAPHVRWTVGIEVSADYFLVSANGAGLNTNCTIRTNTQYPAALSGSTRRVSHLLRDPQQW